MLYLILKLIHIVSSTLLFGTGLGSAFYFWRANRSGDHRAMYFAARTVVIADWLFTTPAVIIQPVTGIWLMLLLGLSLTTDWIAIALSLFILAGVCWLPVVWLQIKMRDFLHQALETNRALPAMYYRYYRIWFTLGWPAFIAVLIIFYLMTFKRVWLGQV